jgi:hypothetical protein
LQPTGQLHRHRVERSLITTQFPNQENIMPVGGTPPSDPTQTQNEASADYSKPGFPGVDGNSQATPSGASPNDSATPATPGEAADQQQSVFNAQAAVNPPPVISGL